MQATGIIGVVTVLLLGCGTAGTSSGGAPPTANARITVRVRGAGAGRVTSTPTGIDCPGSCSTTAQVGTHLTLTAQPGGGSAFAGWGSACTGSGGCIISIAKDADVDVTFQRAYEMVDLTDRLGGGSPGVTPTDSRW